MESGYVRKTLAGLFKNGMHYNNKVTEDTVQGRLWLLFNEAAVSISLRCCKDLLIKPD